MGQGRGLRWLAVVSLLVAGVPGAVAESGTRDPSATGAAEAPPPAVPDLGSLGLPLEELLGEALEGGGLLDTGGIDRLRVPGAIRVLLVSSGVNQATFGDAYGERLAVHGGGDSVGLGTYAASVLFQVAPEARITSFNVYDGERVSRGGVIHAVEWARDHADQLDAVVLAFPPAEVLDPVGAGLASGAWAELSDAAKPASGRLHGLADGWQRLRERLAELAAGGVTVVVPAGDLGPAPQSLLGVAGLPEVLTVGAFDGNGVAPASASGPSVHGRVKPDLVAPVGLPGLVPEPSALASVLAAAGTPAEGPALELPFPAAGGRSAVIGSTIPAAIVVTAAVAQLRMDGVSDAATVRGVLTAAAEPQAEVPVWRQGAGVVREAPTAGLASSRPLVGGALDLGAEPATGRTWTAEVPVLGGRMAAAPTASFPWRVETAPDGVRVAVPVPDDAQPRPEIAAAGPGLRLTLPSGDNPWAAGAWCGYLRVPLAGLADVIEDVPSCLVEGLHLTAFNFYIHDLPAEDQTFALLPALPPGAGLLAGPLLVLPLDPLHEPVMAGVSGPDGLVHFHNVPPAFFVMRQFSDYGAPVIERLPGAGGGEGQARGRDLGEAASYLSFEALVLPNPCPERIQDHPATGTDCHRAWLEERFGASSVSYDRTTARYLVATPAGEMGVVFDFTKKSAGVAVSSRYVDLLAHGDLAHGSAASLDDLHGPVPERLGIHLAEAWSFAPADSLGDPEGTLATYKGFDLEQEPWSLVGTSTYPFALTTPNYKGTMSLNFRYDLDDALLAVVVQVAEQTHALLITPQGKIELPPLDPSLAAALPPQTDPKRLFGAATGQVGLEFQLQPGGAEQGTLTFVYVPLEPARPAAVHVGDLSFELTTWQRVDWPPAAMPRDGRMAQGHAFGFDSNYRADQMDHPACRRVADGEVAANVCENWQVFVHSPVDDAETFELVDRDSGQGFLVGVRTAGGGFHHPHRGVHGKREDFEVGGVTLPLGRGVVTNGRFWEQLVVPTQALSAHPGAVEVRLEDNVPGGRSTLLGHADGPVPLAPYVAFAPWHRRIGPGLLDDL